ncbi:hypothetical protein Cgig2_029473 [Carnegiea gigantea]|uniref:K-box domain-containing protein n=1 Tax=Carnegiea gigantea TaxID=171969 RepID=A0A9Q1KLT6_9CARY|nr:hypothetical protein Cgig2_029473 [Carnegiea gigantea]
MHILLSSSCICSMKSIIARYNMQSKNNEGRQEEPFLQLQLENSNLARLSKEIADKNQELRKLKGDNLQGLDLEELQQLETLLENSLSRVLDIKGKRIMHEIDTLQKQGNKLMEENQRLKQEMTLLPQGRRPGIVLDQSESTTLQEGGQSSESITNGSPPVTEDDTSDTSLKLG